MNVLPSVSVIWRETVEELPEMLHRVDVCGGRVISLIKSEVCLDAPEK